MAIPLMLITLGVAVARLNAGARFKSRVVGAYQICRVFDLCACAAGWWFNLPDIAFAVLVLQVTTPVAVTSYMLAEKYGADAQAVAGLVVISTLVLGGSDPDHFGCFDRLSALRGFSDLPTIKLCRFGKFGLQRALPSSKNAGASFLLDKIGTSTR